MAIPLRQEYDAAREIGDEDDLEGNWGGSFSTAGVVCTSTTIPLLPLETSICRRSGSCPTNKHSPLSSLGKEVKG